MWKWGWGWSAEATNCVIWRHASPDEFRNATMISTVWAPGELCRSPAREAAKEVTLSHTPFQIISCSFGRSILSAHSKCRCWFACIHYTIGTTAHDFKVWRQSESQSKGSAPLESAPWEEGPLPLLLHRLWEAVRCSAERESSYCFGNHEYAWFLVLT